MAKSVDEDTKEPTPSIEKKKTESAERYRLDIAMF